MADQGSTLLTAARARELAGEISKARMEKALEKVIEEQMADSIKAIRQSVELGLYTAHLKFGMASRVKEMLMALDYAVTGNSEATRISW